jgi:hypothetical protein
MRNKLGTTKVQLGAGSADSVESKSEVSLRKFKKLCKTAKNTVLLRFPLVGTIQGLLRIRITYAAFYQG